MCNKAGLVKLYSDLKECGKVYVNIEPIIIPGIDDDDENDIDNDDLDENNNNNDNSSNATEWNDGGYTFILKPTNYCFLINTSNNSIHNDQLWQQWYH